MGKGHETWLYENVPPLRKQEHRIHHGSWEEGKASTVPASVLILWDEIPGLVLARALWGQVMPCIHPEKPRETSHLREGTCNLGHYSCLSVTPGMLH